MRGREGIIVSEKMEKTERGWGCGEKKSERRREDSLKERERERERDRDRERKK